MTAEQRAAARERVYKAQKNDWYRPALDYAACTLQDLPAALDALDAADKTIADLRTENSEMARQLAEPSENQELKQRISDLEADLDLARMALEHP